MITSLIVCIYLALAFCNYNEYKAGKTNRFIVLLSFALLLFMMCRYSYVENNYDLSNYYRQYLYQNPMEDQNFGFYYLFFSLMRLGQILGLSFQTWWYLLTILSFILIVIALKLNRSNIHLWLIFFMLYFVFAFYTGLKFYYGFCVFLIGYLFLVRGGKRNKLLYVIFTCLAGGFHVMYYAYLILLFLNSKASEDIRKNKLIKIIAGVSIVLTIFFRINGSASSFFSAIFAQMETDKFDTYLSLKTGMGFYLPVVLHLSVLLFVWKSRKIISYESEDFGIVNSILFTSLLIVAFYPLFLISTVFMRIVSAFSLAAITAVGIDSEERFLYQRRGFVMAANWILVTIYFIKFVIGLTWELSVVPFFTF